MVELRNTIGYNAANGSEMALYMYIIILIVTHEIL